ncbi:aminopeptidase [Candidatus Woesearchaeota archaeon]|nr:aminopeptidase [Candidatus Woesearchaeota archaeon]
MVFLMGTPVNRLCWDKMKYRELMGWLDEEELLSTVKANYERFIPILKKCIKLKNEKLLIAGDLGQSNKRIPALMMGCYVLAAKAIGIKYAIAVQKPKFVKTKADKDLIQAMAKLPQKSALALTYSGKIGSLGTIGKSYRRFAEDMKHKFLSTGGLSSLSTDKFEEFMKSVDIDYEMMHKRARVLNEKMTKADRIRVRTEKGTDVIFRVEGKKAISNDGRIYKDKLGGNLPAGEVYIPPRGRQVEGKVVIDGSVKYNGDTKLMVEDTVTLNIKNGEVTTIRGGLVARKLEEYLRKSHKKAKYPWGIRRIGELGIGINPGASLLGPTLVNEKTLGTAHVAIGSNYWFGGTIYAIIHLDQVFKDPIIYIDGKRISV